MGFPPVGTSVPSLANWQLSYGGVTMGTNTPIGFSKIEGLLDTPSPRSSDSPRPRDLGELTGIDFTAGRDIVMTGDVTTDATSLQHQLEAIGTVMQSQGSTEQPLWFMVPNLPLLCSMVRPRKNTTPYDFAYSWGLASKVMQFHATDPRLYSAPSAGYVGVPTPLGGMTFNATFPLTFGGGNVAGILNVNNAGNVESRPVLVLTGPMTNPTVLNATTGWSLSFSNPSQTSYTLNAGDTLTVDLDLRTVTYVASGTTAGASRINWLVPGSIWPNVTAGIQGLQPGNNVVEFTTQDSGAVAGTLGVQFSSAYYL